MYVYAAALLKDHAEASSQLLIKVGYYGRKCLDDGNFGSQSTEDGCELAADDAASDYDQLIHGMIKIKELVAGDHF